jgi:hypothetical protein
MEQNDVRPTQALRLQELWTGLPLRRPSPERRRVLLRPRVYLRTVLRLPGVVRMRGGQEEVV